MTSGSARSSPSIEVSVATSCRLASTLATSRNASSTVSLTVLVSRIRFAVSRSSSLISTLVFLVPMLP
jgi:hypothetical protein